MELEISVKEVVNGLQSTRMMDRKRNAEMLKELLTRNAVPSLLTDNTLKKRGYSWDDLFDDIDSFVMKEIEKSYGLKGETSKTFDNFISSVCTTLLHQCVSGANKGKAFIKCSKIIKACLWVFNNNDLVKVLGDCYLNLLLKHVLPYDNYFGHITPSTWKELLEACIAACLSNNYKLDNFTKLRIVLLVMKRGNDGCQFVIPLMESVDLIERIFAYVANDKKVQDILIEIVILLLETLSSEYRLTMCLFTESVLPCLLKFYDQNKDQKKKASLFNLLNLIVTLHHPLGRCQNEEGSLANKWEVWNKYMNSITEIICLEVNYLQKIRKQNDRIFQQCTHFHNLAANVYYLIFNPIEKCETDKENTSKRIKINLNKNKSLNDLIAELQRNHVPWLGILTVYVKKYCATISSDDYLSLLSAFQVLLSNISSNLDWDLFQEVVCLVLEKSRDLLKGDYYKYTLVSLWNSCVRHSTSTNATHKAVHIIMQNLLHSDVLDYSHAQNLIKIYLEKDMPVSCNSVKSLSHIFYKFYGKCSSEDFRLQCFLWLENHGISSVYVNEVSELLFRIIANENIEFPTVRSHETEYDNLREILFNSPEKCILFSEFEINNTLITVSQKPVNEHIEIVSDIYLRVETHLRMSLGVLSAELDQNDAGILNCIKLINVTLLYLDNFIKYNLKSEEEIRETNIYETLIKTLGRMFTSLKTLLESNSQISIKIKIVQLAKQLLMCEFSPALSSILRSKLDADLFHAINTILNTESKSNNDIVVVGDEDDMNMETLKYNCLYLLAAYCRNNADFRDEIAQLVLDPNTYEISTDYRCIFQCINIIISSNIEDAPLELILNLIQCMCKQLYKDSNASYEMIKILHHIMDTLCLDINAKNNCGIMLESYLKLCDDMFYPPRVVCLIYECVAKMISLDCRQQAAFKDGIKKKIKGEVHNMRVYCCYLLKIDLKNIIEDVDNFFDDLLDIFTIDVANKKESILKDESANRTLTVFHCYLALVQADKSRILNIILQIIYLQNIKSLNNDIVMKVLNQIINASDIKDLKTYLNNNILSIIHFWLCKKDKKIEDLPLSLFGFDSIDEFIERHVKWLIAGEVLWQKGGDVKKSEILKRIVKKHKKPIENIIEMCFSNIMALCLPDVVSVKYKIQNKGNKTSIQNGNKMFQQTCEILGNEKFSSLFVENVGELLLLTASHMVDCGNATELLKVKGLPKPPEFYYPKKIQSAILDYFEDLTDESVLQYVCKNQTTAVFKILIELWKGVIEENIFELKVLALHTYITFVVKVPLDQLSDAFMCHFVCNSFTQAIKLCNNNKEMEVFIIGLNYVLDHLFPKAAHLMCRPLLELVSVLIIKKEAGYKEEIDSFLHTLLENMKNYLRRSKDVMDFLSYLSQGVSEIKQCPNIAVFKEKIKAHRIALSRPSYEMLQNINRFLTLNSEHIHQLYNELDSKSFSEDCETSIIHQIIQSLCNILKSSYDDKTVIEASNCLSKISSYDLKTLVTVPPANTEIIRSVNPTHYFMQVVAKSLIEVLFDGDPTVTDEAVETMNDLLKFLDIDNIPDLEEIDKIILSPFCNATKMPIDTVSDSMNFEEHCNRFPDGIFIHEQLGKSNTDWLKEVTCTLLNFIHSSTSYIEHLRKVCNLKPLVCQKILPALIGLLLKDLSARHISALSEHVNNFFLKLWERTFNDRVENSGDSNIDANIAGTMTHSYKTIVQYMLGIVDFVRIQRNYYTMRPGGAAKILNFLELDYGKVAWAAAVVNQNWAAVYYGELWAMLQNNGVMPSSPELTSCLPGGENLQRIFRKCYVSVGEVDAIEGCGTAHLTIETEKRKHLINTGQFTDALLLHDIALSCNQSEPDLHYGVVSSLHKSGMHHLALRYIKSLPEDEQLNDVKYECLAFLGDWSAFVNTQELEDKCKHTNVNHNSVVKAFQYACLKNCLNIRTTPENENNFLIPLNKAKLAVSRLCHNFNMENSENIYKVVEKLHIFNDIEDYFAVRTNRSRLSDLLQKWNIDRLPPFSDFKHIEGLSSQRVLILEHAAKNNSRMMNEVVSLQIQYAKMALNNRRVQMAQRLLSLAKKCQPSEDITLVESEIAWAKNHKEIALSLLRDVITQQSLDVKLTAVSLRRYALWMADSKRDNPREIIHKYLQKSLDVLQGTHMDVRLKVYLDIAKFADAEYKQVDAYMNSSVFENRVKCLENMKGTASSLGVKATKSLTREEGRALSTNRKFKELDEAEIANTRAEKQNFLQLAMKYYLLSLKQCDENNLSVFRVISLWLANQSFEFNESETDTFCSMLNTIPSWKFVTVLPQLAPRLTNENTPFMNTLKSIIKRCAIDHPHHTLPILFGLKNSDKDSIYLNTTGKGGQVRNQEPRVTAAQELVAELRGLNNQFTTIVTQMENMCDAIISFANYAPVAKTKKQKVPDKENIHKLRNLNAVAVPTVTVEIKKDCKYSHINKLHSFDTYYELVGGVNCPKKINCKDSTGRNYVVLIKGGDDLKQDAVMQQVFNIVNTLLEKDPVTNRNKLLIRTYKVVPMSRLSGVLEWCEGTIPMGLYLVGMDSVGAHGRYRPQDMSCDAARKKMIACSNDSHEVKLSVYNRIINEFKPVFQHFFTEHYLDPVTWYERRLAYTKSVATSSMVGYILGLGDRHVYNILIDKRTAEVIHIDLGIAFDQGKTLRTPETVPFRLTRDIIAGFGSSGTEGIFKRCCEKTMELLRDNQETLLTILEVLLCDPLYSWSVKTAQQNAPTSSRNSNDDCATSSPSGLAKRALLVVTSKLSGTEDGVTGGVAVPGQVARLLHIATDPFNLCRLFHGWQPYL